MTSSRPRADRVLSAASTGLLILLLPFAFLSVSGAAASLGRDLDSPRSIFAVLAAAPLLVTAAGSAWVVSLRRAAGHERSGQLAVSRASVLLGLGATAALLLHAATGGEQRWDLSSAAAVGVLLVLLPVAARRPRAALQLAGVLAVVLLGTALVRDLPPADLQGPAPVTSPVPGPAAPLTPSALPPPPGPR